MAGAATPLSTAATTASVFLLFILDVVVAGRGQGRRRDNKNPKTANFMGEGLHGGNHKFQGIKFCGCKVDKSHCLPVLHKKEQYTVWNPILLSAFHSAPRCGGASRRAAKELRGRRRWQNGPAQVGSMNSSAIWFIRFRRPTDDPRTLNWIPPRAMRIFLIWF